MTKFYQMKNIVIFGPPGSGKGTQSEFIIEKYKVTHISTGDVLRAEMKAESPLGVEAKKHIEQGNLVPDALIIDMLGKCLDESNNENGVIFDGFPRTVAQAEALKVMLNERGQDIHVMLNLQVPDEVLVERLLIRGQESGRSDDNLETIKKRIEVYNEQTVPVIAYYEKEGKHVGIEGVGSIEEIAASIASAIDNA